MSITNFKPQIWTARLLVAWRKSLVYGGPMVVNRDYEGDIADAGDVVKITSISDPTISDYVPNSTVITPEELTDAQRNLVIDQSKYWAFKVDDVDKRQAKGNVMPEAMSRAAYRLRDVADQYVAGLYTGVASGNNLGTISVVAATPTDAYDDVLIPLKVTLDDGDVPTEGRYCVIPPWFTGRLLRDDRFVRADASGTTEALRNGFVGRAAGFNIVQSNNTPNPTGDDNVIQAGVNAAISFAEQINKTEAYRPESSFADAVKGLALYGAKLVRPDGIAIATASQT
ncbi:P22 phage major capsid protein family protein [Streptomyces adelaidensis]|uniref:P22 phage major capsid protein family protein n=1 Tax=Streptomyces adelaidensis TaxID=2796465 RepID=UPI0019080FC0|nr:P22 phage major capsid protein family protein [Streptomyces adelaidensis]